MGDQGKNPFSSFFTKEQYATQTEMLDLAHKSQKLQIGIPKETTMVESRVALVPNSIRVLTGHGHRVIIESGAGEKSRFSDHHFSEAGAEVTSDKTKVFQSHVLLKVQPPTPEEIDLLTYNQMLISPLSIPIITDDYIKKLQDKKVTAAAMEYMQAKDGSFPVVRIMSEIAGQMSIQTAAELLTNQNQGRGVILGSISGVPPTKVVILGAGVTGEYATKAALAMGASVRVFDNNIYKLMDLQDKVGRQLHTSTINPVYLAYQLLSADVVIGALHSETGRAPVVVTEEMVSKMKKGSVIVDISIDQGGCIETSQVTTHKSPTFTKHGVIHYCVPNIASKVSRTASIAFSNILVPLLLRMGNSVNLAQMLYNNEGIRNGIYMYKGKLTNEYLAKRFGIKYMDLNLILTSDL